MRKMDKLKKEMEIKNEENGASRSEASIQKTRIMQKMGKMDKLKKEKGRK